MKNIGLLYVKGSLPAFENFGKLPTHLLKENGMINGQKAYEVLDGLILPGGSIVESQSISREVETVIKKMNSQGKFILGMCSGFQVLANKTDIGRKSPFPIEKEGLGILNVTFHPLIGTDRVESEVVDESFLTKGMVGQTVTGFHCHTYGDIRGNAPPIFFSKVKRTNYAENPRMILSGVRNDEGNVIGTMLHASLDENPSLVDNILKFIDANHKDFLEIYEANKVLVNKMKGEVGIGCDIYSDYRLPTDKPKTPPWLMIAGTGSDSGKTFITTGIVGVLRKKGYKVCVLKIGPDIRDLAPSLYLNKEKMEEYSSIQIGGLGWKNLEEIITDVNGQNYDLILVEGVMSIFTGILNEKIPFSTAEIAKAGKIPVLLVTGCNKGGIETAAIDLASHTDMLQKIGIKTAGLILNKVYNEKIAETALNYLKNTTQLEWVGKVPKVQLTARGGTPEVEIKLEDFCCKAIETVEKYLDVDKIIRMAETPKFIGYPSYKEIKKVFI
ncbi:MAG TPA: AAA family ATPase [Methanothermobacter sp.]|nr:AAA family ATPase [Methanothermobacter sp.]